MNDLVLSHLDKIYWPKEKITKGELLEYYQKIAPVILPYIKGRPISLNRFPEGISGENFYQKDVSNLHLPKWVETKEIHGVKYLICNNEKTLLFIANLGSIEINTWLSKTSSLEQPDWLVIDLDPEEIEFKFVVRAAQKCHELFDQLNIPSFPKTSGATGMHILIPLGAKYNYHQAKNLAKILVTMVNNQLPDFTSIVRQPKKRRGKVYLDFLQNEHGQTIAAPYSVRPVLAAQVSTPLSWDEINEKLSPANFTIKNISSRLEKITDPAKSILHHPGIKMKSIISRLQNFNPKN